MFDTKPTPENIAEQLVAKAPDGHDETWDRVVANLATVLITSWDRLNRKEQRTIFDVAAQLHRYEAAGTLPHVENPIRHNDDGSYTITMPGSPEDTITVHPSPVGAEEQVPERAASE